MIYISFIRCLFFLFLIIIFLIALNFFFIFDFFELLSSKFVKECIFISFTFFTETPAFLFHSSIFRLARDVPSSKIQDLIRVFKYLSAGVQHFINKSFLLVWNIEMV